MMKIENGKRYRFELVAPFTSITSLKKNLMVTCSCNKLNVYIALDVGDIIDYASIYYVNQQEKIYIQATVHCHYKFGNVHQTEGYLLILKHDNNLKISVND